MPKFKRIRFTSHPKEIQICQKQGFPHRLFLSPNNRRNCRLEVVIRKALNNKSTSTFNYREEDRITLTPLQAYKLSRYLVDWAGKALTDKEKLDLIKRQRKGNMQ